MKLTPALASLALALAALSASAQSGPTTSQTSASSGSVAGLGDVGGWTGLAGSAANATVGYESNGSPVTPGDPTKFASGSGGPQGKPLAGFTDRTPNGSSSSSGQSSVSTPNGSTDAPTYYTANWTSNSQAADAADAPTSGGTFDPFPIRYGDVSGLLRAGSGTASLYYQASLRRDGTLAIPDSGGTASYRFSIFTTEANGTTLSILDLAYSSEDGASVRFTPNAGFTLFRLGSTADDPNANPTVRTDNGRRITSQSDAEALLSSFNFSGRLNGDLSFGILRDVTIRPGGAPTDRLFEWHTDTRNRVVPPVPEPASLAALGLGALALLRRRRKG